MKKYLLLLLCIPLTSQELADVLWSKVQLSNTFHYADISQAAIDLPNNGKSFSGILKVDQPAVGIGYNVIIDSRKIYQDNHKNIEKDIGNRMSLVKNCEMKEKKSHIEDIDAFEKNIINAKCQIIRI